MGTEVVDMVQVFVRLVFGVVADGVDLVGESEYFIVAEGVSAHFHEGIGGGTDGVKDGISSMAFTSNIPTLSRLTPPPLPRLHHLYPVKAPDFLQVHFNVGQISRVVEN